MSNCPEISQGGIARGSIPYGGIPCSERGSGVVSLEYYLITEAGDYIITEADDNLVVDSDG